MKELRAEARSGAKDKIRRMTGPIRGRVDATGWKEPTDMDAEAPTGPRPVSRRAYKKGGKVEGAHTPVRADRKPRKSGGYADEMVNRNVKEANEERPGKKHVGGMKRGGAAFEGTAKDERQDKKLAKKHGMSMKDWESSKLDKKHDEQENMDGLKKGGRTKRGIGGVLKYLSPIAMVADAVGGHKKDDERKDGGRTKRASGGRTKGKTNINIVIAPQGQQPQPQMAPDMPPPPPRSVPMPMPPQGAPQGMPQGAPVINNIPAAPPPMPRQRGGRTKMTAGALSGEGRLQKIDLQKSGRGV